VVLCFYSKKNNPSKNYKIVIQNKVVQFNTYNFFGVVLFSKKEYSKAIQVFDRGLKLNPEHAEMYLNYGNALAVSTKYKEAISVF
jgi:tetratricopeptide (TPR) repeat protein